MSAEERTCAFVLIVIAILLFDPPQTRTMECRYGERGSLTVYCVNATPPFIRTSRYRYDHLDETFKCVDCNLERLEEGTFDISSNQLKIVDIRNSSIEIIYKKAFTGLVYMETLYLSNNPISMIYPGAFSGIKKVKYLEMENAVSRLGEDVFQELIHLNVLILRKNNLSSLERDTFAGLGNLIILDLSNNKLVEIHNIFNPLVKLELLKLQNNLIQEIDGSEFVSLRKLIALNLDNNRLQAIKKDFPSLDKLQSLTLTNNSLSEKNVKLGTFQNLHGLEVLDLSYNTFSELPNKFFLGLYTLRILNLSGNYIHEFSTGKFSGLPHLRSLDLSNNKLETAKVTGRLALTSLHTLDVSVNHIHSFDYKSLLQRFPKLSEINFSKNNLSCEVYIALKTFLQKDNINVVVTEENLQHCKPDPKLTNEKLEPKISSNDSVDAQGTFVIIMFIMVIVIILMVGVLYYFEFFVLLRMRQDVFNIRQVY